MKRPSVMVPGSQRVKSSVLYYATQSGPPYDKIDPKTENKIAANKLHPDPEAVSGGSSVRHVFEDSQAPKTDDADMLAGIRHDVVSSIFNRFPLSV
jgi:hypothetical protein